MGKAEFEAEKITTNILAKGKVVDQPIIIGGREYNVTCVNVGNPHCVVFGTHIDAYNLAEIGPDFENAKYFPEKINTEFVRVVDSRTLRMRVWERGNGETYACGTGACAAVVAAVENGFCKKGEEVIVKLKGGDLAITYNDDGIFMTGNAVLVYEGEAEY